MNEKFRFIELSQLSRVKEDSTKSSSIPRLLHLIWVGDRLPPAYVQPQVEQWRQLMPNWTVRLWLNQDINESEFQSNILQRIRACRKGAQKADIMRFEILRKYGGIYLDTDIRPHRSLEPILSLDASFVVCHDIPVTWSYIASAFFASIPDHPILLYAQRLCLGVPINTEDIHMHTGPRLLGEAIACTELSELTALLDYRYFYRNIIGDLDITEKRVTQDVPERFGNHFYAKDW